MPKATRAPSILISPPPQLSAAEKARRLKDRQLWLKDVDLLQAFNELFEYMPEYRVFLKRRPGEIMFLSRAMLRTLHVEDEANLIGLTDHELTPGPLADLYQSRDEMVLRTGKPLVGVLEVWFTPEGLPEWFTCYKLPLRNRDGQTVGIIGFLKEYDHPMDLPFHEPLKTLVDYIKENLGRPITVKELAERAYLSTRQVQRLFRQEMGLNPKSFITKMRVHRAVHLLISTDLPLSEIALQVGFCDQSALTYYFRRELGLTPRRFRRAARDWKESNNCRSTL